jgi:hypothetical protein
MFESAWDIAAYAPRALANAYFAPFPWQWLSTSGQTGVFRAMASIEVVLIVILVPAMLRGLWPRIRRFRADEWTVIVFVAAVAIGYGTLMANGGTLFRSRLQFLFPTLVLAAPALLRFLPRSGGAPAADAQPRPDDLPTQC